MITDLQFFTCLFVLLAAFSIFIIVLDKNPPKS